MNTLKLNRYKMWHWRLISVFILANAVWLPCEFQAGVEQLGTVPSWVLVFSGFEWCHNYRNVFACVYESTYTDRHWCNVPGDRDFYTICSFTMDCSQLQRLQHVFCYWNTKSLLCLSLPEGVYIYIFLVSNSEWT